jgi:valyl-tRNA synthetase
LTENLYQTLREYIPEDPSVPDARSIHFLMFPDVKEEYFDEVIERQVKRMQAVIDLTRYIREKNTLSLKVGFIHHYESSSANVPHRRLSKNSSSSTPRSSTLLT